MLLRKSKIEDLVWLREIAELCFSETDEAAELLFSKLWIPENCYVAETENRACAMAMALPLELKTPERRVKAAYIYYVATHPEYQRQGIGSALLKAIVDCYPNVRQIQLTTDCTEKTIAFYKSAGFIELSEIECCGFIKDRAL